MESRQSLTNFLGKDKYIPITSTRPEKVLSTLKFIEQVDNHSLRTIFKVGFAEIRRRIINSSRGISIIDNIESDILQYIAILHKYKCVAEYLTSDKLSNYCDPDYRLYVFFMYLYFTCLNDECNETISRQQVLDMILAYSTNRKRTSMLEFIFIAIVSERQLSDGYAVLKCSQYEDLNILIKCSIHEKDLVLSRYEESNMDKPYIDSYTDAYSEALEYQTELEKEYKYSILEFKE